MQICILNYDLVKALKFSQFMKERNVKFVKTYYTKTMQIWQLCLKLWSSQSLEIPCMKDNYFIQQFMKGKMSSLWKHITLKQCKWEIFVSNYDLVKAWKFSPWKIIILHYSSWKKAMPSLWKHFNHANGRFLSQIMI